MITKTTLCLDCELGLVRELENEDATSSFINKCLLGGDYVSVITSCNRYKKINTKVTYHDPDFGKYEKEATEEEI